MLYTYAHMFSFFCATCQHFAGGYMSLRDQITQCHVHCQTPSSQCSAPCLLACLLHLATNSATDADRGGIMAWAVYALSENEKKLAIDVTPFIFRRVKTNAGRLIYCSNLD